MIDVLSEVAQGPILVPLLFIIFINDLDDGAINKFADDTKTVSTVGTAEDVKVPQNDFLHKLFQWSKDYQLSLNITEPGLGH